MAEDKALSLSVLSTIRDWVKSLVPSTYAGSSSAGGNATKANTILYGEVDSTSTSTVYTATISGLTELTDGTIIMLKNGVVTSASGFTININNLGAKPCYSNMATGNDITPTAPTRDTTIFNINYTMLLIYSEDIVDGGGWICYRGYDANTNTIGYQIRTNSSSLPTTKKFYRYRILFTSPDGTHFVPSNTSTSTNATANRDVNQEKIDPFGRIVYYNYTTAIEADARPGATYLMDQMTMTFGYAFNRTGAALTLTAWAPIYLKCAPQTDGSAIIDADTPYVQALPSTNDGKIYIFLGVAYSATAVELMMHHPVYYHDGTSVRQWVGRNIPTKTSDLTNDSGFISSSTQSDWDESDTTSDAYVLNRTHYRTSLGYTLTVDMSEMASSIEESQWTVPIDGVEHTYEYYHNGGRGEIDLLEMFGSSVFPTKSAADFNLTATNIELTVDGTTHLLQAWFEESENGVFYYNNTYFVNIWPDGDYIYLYLNSNDDQPIESAVVNIPITNEAFEYSKLDPLYLDGSLIISGEGRQSEIFNGSSGKRAIGIGSHVEGWAWGSGVSVYVTGEAGSTEYFFQFSGYAIDEARLNRSMGSKVLNSDTGEYIEGVFLSDIDFTDSMISFTATLDATNDLSNAEFIIESSRSMAAGWAAHAEGQDTVAYGDGSHSEGGSTLAGGYNSHAEGEYSIASGYRSHAEGCQTEARGDAAHAEGWATNSFGYCGHTEGCRTAVFAEYAHAEGLGTSTAIACQHVQGKYNVSDANGVYADIVGNGTSASSRSNAYTLDWSGNGWYAGKVTVGTSPTNNMDVATKQYVDNATAGMTTTLSGLTDTTITSPSNGQYLKYDSASGKWVNATPVTYTLSLSNNVITLTGSDGSTSSITLPVYNGGVST